jgi:hypothetical protein
MQEAGQRLQACVVPRLRPVLLLGFLLLVARGSAGEQIVASFSLKDHLNRPWHHELVFFPVDDHIFKRDGLALLGPDDKPHAYQWVPAEQAPDNTNSIAFCASVPQLGKSDYRLVPGRNSSSTDLRVSAAADSATIENGAVGIRLGGPQARTSGPIAGIKLRTGWQKPAGHLKCQLAPTSHDVTVVAKGPVFADVLVAYAFPGFCYWRLRFRVIAGEPVVLVDEEFTLPAGSTYELDLSDGWAPDQVFYRDNANNCRLAQIAELPSEEAFLLRPWPTWWGAIPESNWVALCHSRKDEMLMIGCRDPGTWVEPNRTDWDTTVAITKPGFRASFQLRGFRRKWMMAVTSKAESVPQDKTRVAPLPQHCLIKHGDVPLNTIKDYVLAWNDSKTRRPGLFLLDKEKQRFQRRFQIDQERLRKLRETKVYSYLMDEHAAYFLATGDRELGRKLADAAFEHLQHAVEGLVAQNELRNQGSCPHHRVRAVMWSAILGDLALTPGVLTGQARERIKAQLAFLGYTLSSPSFHSPERGYRANPNMTTMARGMVGLLAAAVPSHPQARTWAKLFTDEAERELNEWCGPNGGWLEAPHYMTASMDSIIGPALALRGKNLSDVALHEHPKLKKAIAWLAKISTPPDPRLGGDRHMPAIGNTYLGERTCLPGWAAWMWQDTDAGFSRNMQWMWKAQGAPRTPGIGGAYPGLQGYALVLLNPKLPAAPPRWESELFPQAGAVFRAHFPSDHETYMHYIQGPMHQHYDYDEGSFILWGQGRPLCEDFAYYGRAPAADHSRVDDGFPEQLGNEGLIREFATGAVDYLRGERAGWHRQILFVKDRDPLGPNYFVIRDSVLSGREADWRVWLATDETPRLDQNPVRVTGRHGVDLVVFFASPATARPTTERISRKTGASGFDTKESSQYCLHLKMPVDQPIAVVLYPLGHDQRTPKMTSLGGGRTVKIESEYGTDYAMLALEGFQFSDEGMSFDGKAGAVQIRKDAIQLSLPRRGKLVCRKQTVESNQSSDKTLSRRFRP